MRINHSSSSIKSWDFKDIDKIIEKNYVGQGEITKELEDELCRFTGKRFSRVVNSGSSALLLVLLTLQQNHTGRQVITSSYVCSSVINCILQAGLDVELADINNDNLNVNPESIISKINSDTLAIVVPHISGIPVDTALLKHQQIPIIEDCAQSIGSLINQHPTGFDADIIIYSFGSTKMITGGIGGAVLTNSEKYYQCLVDLSNYEKNPFEYFKTGISGSRNVSISDINSSVILNQLNQLTRFIKMRRNVAKHYDDFFLSKKDVILQKEKSGTFFNRYRYYILTSDAKPLCSYLNSMKIDARSSIAHNIAEYMRISDCYNLSVLKDKVVSLPIYPNLFSQQIEQIMEALQKYYG